MMKNKVVRDIQHSERVNEDKLRQFRTMITEKNDAAEAQNSVTFELIKDKQKAMDNKLSKVEETEVIIDYFKTELEKLRRQTKDDMHENSQRVEQRFEKLIHEELTHEEGLFGKKEDEDLIKTGEEEAKEDGGEDQDAEAAQDGQEPAGEAPPQ